MPETIKIGRKLNTVTINRRDIYNEMFSTDLDRIKEFIAVSDYPDRIDPNVILKINKKAVKLSKDDFSDYTETLDSEDLIMLYLFENTIRITPHGKITRILKKIIDPTKKCSEDELLALMNWESSNHSIYCTLKAIESGELILH